MDSARAIYVLFILGIVSAAKRPHIIFMVADDLGWNDLGYNNQNENVHSRSLDEYAGKGIKLGNSYVQPVCSPSRGSFMSGYYPFHTGLQSGIIDNNTPKFLPSNFTTLPQKLKELGYATHMVGKWHLGFCNWKYTPTHRGFDSFMGYYSGGEDYYTHMAGNGRAYDFRFNESVYHPKAGEYSTYTYTKRAQDILHAHDPASQPLFLYMAYQSVHAPLEVPDQYITASHHTHRNIYLGMVNAMDQSFRSIMNALRSGGYDDNLLVIFTSDNGGSIIQGGNNWPLRGAKGTLWEGGTKAVGFVYSPPGVHSLLQKVGYTNNELIHAVDWFPTIITAAGGIPDSRMDGISQWETLRRGIPSNRTEFVYNIDETSNKYAIRQGDYKLIHGEKAHDSGWYHPGQHPHAHPVVGTGDTELFNIRADPTEHHNIASQHPDIVSRLHQKILTHKKTLMPAQNAPENHRANPAHYNNVWSPGWC